MTNTEIKLHISIEDILSNMYGLEVKRRMPCPIHGGENDNFAIKEGYYYCFSCNASGDIFSLVQAISKVNFSDAKKLICEFFNIDNSYKKLDSRILEKTKLEQRAKYILKRLRDYQQIRICQALCLIRTENNDSFLEIHLENLLSKFESDSSFVIKHDIHAHMKATLIKFLNT